MLGRAARGHFACKIAFRTRFTNFPLIECLLVDLLAAYEHVCKYELNQPRQQHRWHVQQITQRTRSKQSTQAFLNYFTSEEHLKWISGLRELLVKLFHQGSLKRMHLILVVIGKNAPLQWWSGPDLGGCWGGLVSPIYLRVHPLIHETWWG